MTGAAFHQWVSDPSTLDRESIAQLQELMKRFPYFQTVHLLLAKNLKAENNIDQRRQLHLAAIYASDRKLLFGLMEGTHPLREEIGKEKIENRNPADSIENGELGIEKSASHTIEREVEYNREEEAFLVESVEVGVAVPTPAIEAIVSEVEARTIENESLVTENVAKEEVLAEVEHSSLYDLIPEPLLYRIEDADLPDLPQTDVPEEEPSELPFDQWLERLTKPVSVVSLPRSHVSRPANSKDNLSLIADFLASQQKDGRTQRAEFFKPSKAAERSNQQDFTVITETLANIYEQQGKHELAVKAFDALALKYPEKSSYFAARKMAAQEKLDGHP